MGMRARLGWGKIVGGLSIEIERGIIVSKWEEEKLEEEKEHD